MKNSILKKLDCIKSAALFASLTLTPELHSNCYRLERIVHDILGKSTGQKKLTKNDVKSIFDSYKGSQYDHYEDPAEDVMVALVYHNSRSYCLAGGLWHGNNFTVQRMINIVDTMPYEPIFNNLRNKLRSLLIISDDLMERHSLERYAIGNRFPHKEFPSINVNKPIEIADRVSYSVEDLTDLGIDTSDIEPFLFPLENKTSLIESTNGNSPLEDMPIIKSHGKFYIMLPTAIGIAIINHIINFCSTEGMLDALEVRFQEEYLRYFNEEIQMPNEYKNIQFSPIINKRDKIFAVQSAVEFDKGRFYHLVLYFDDFENYEDEKFNGHSSNIENNSDIIIQNVIRTSEQFSKMDVYRGGFSLIVLCSWGRGLGISSQNVFDNNWKLAGLTAYDFHILSMNTSISISTLWRLLEAEKAVESLGIQIQNPNGLLNLYAWAKQNDFHILPHEQIPEDLRPNNLNGLLLSIDPFSIHDSRSSTYNEYDRHILVNPSGESVLVQKVNADAYFSEDKDKPIYISLDDLEKKNLVSSIRGNNINWWFECICERHMRSVVYPLWTGFNDWIFQTEKNIGHLIGSQKYKTVEWKIIVTDIDSSFDVIPQNFNQSKKDISTESRIVDYVLYVESTLGKGFFNNFRQEANEADKAILWSLLDCISENSEKKLDSNELVGLVIEDNSSRTIHGWEAKTYRDHIAEFLPKPFFIDSFDDATNRVGLGWLARNKEESMVVEGINECTAYLAKLNDVIWESVKKQLKSFNREILIRRLIINHEAIENEKHRWNSTIRALLALHKNKNKVLDEATHQITLMNGGSLGTRLVIEMALCECNPNGGKVSGTLDLSLLMCNAVTMHHIGGWSDSIKYEMTIPKIKIAATGNLLFDQAFYEQVITPYGKKLGSKSLNSHAKKYSSFFEENENDKGKLDNDFYIAWKEEFGFEIDTARKIIDIIEDEGLKKELVIYAFKKANLLKVLETNSIDSSSANAFFDLFTLIQRDKWENIPKGFKSTDIWPWRYKRRLSLVARPILKLDKEYLVAPEMLRSALGYILTNSYYGNFEPEFFKEKKMRSWIGRVNSKSGNEFNKIVANEFEKNRWEVIFDVYLSKLLNKKIDRKWGDIDVVAWSKVSGKVLLIECKDLDLARTNGEIARQTYEFRGKLRTDTGKPDRLLKHIKRVDQVKNNMEDLKKNLKLEKEPIINSILLFRNIVPVMFASFDVFQDLQVIDFESIGEIDVN